MLTVAKMTTSSGRPHRHAFYDVGLATQNLILQAMALGLYVHPMAGFDGEKARTIFGIPEGYEPVTMLALGYLGDPETLDAKRREQELTPRKRKALREFVFEGEWGKTADSWSKQETKTNPMFPSCLRAFLWMFFVHRKAQGTRRGLIRLGGSFAATLPCI